jgi:hypothetical protein
MKTKIAIFLFLIPGFLNAQDPNDFLSPPQILNRVIQYYDPAGIWDHYRGEMHLYTLRPEEGSTEEDLVLDNASGHYQSILYINGAEIVRRLDQEDVFFSINGRADVTGEERKTFGLDKENLQWYFHHHSMHFGLPMHLRDQGINLEPKAHREVFNGKECLVLTFAGNPDEQTPAYFADPIHLYIDPSDYSMAGVRYENQTRQYPSCYVLFNQEIEVGGIRIPKVKTYYREADSSYWFTDAFYPFTRGNFLDEEAEQAAIRKVLDEETYYFYVRDYHKWVDCWSHKPDVFFSFTSKDGYTIKKGWEEISDYIGNFMRQNPDPHEPPIERSNFVYHLQGNLAWVYFDNREGDLYGRYQRVLRKENGQWKVINMTGINEASYEE